MNIKNPTTRVGYFFVEMCYKPDSVVEDDHLSGICFAAFLKPPTLDALRHPCLELHRMGFAPCLYCYRPA